MLKVRCQMLIRREASVVFNAFVDPKITKQFWFSKSSGPVVEGGQLTWEWEKYGAKTRVDVKEIIPSKSIKIAWGVPQRNVTFKFEALTDNETYVVIEETDHPEKGDELIATLLDSTGGFTTVLDGLKCYLEHGISLNLIEDKFQ